MDPADRLRALADLVPILESPDADFGHWEAPPAEGGVLQMPYYSFGPTADAFRAAVGRGNWIVKGFDWGAWLQTSEGQSLSDGQAALADASPDQLAQLITAIIRSDRFVEGSLAGAFESGLLSRIARRAAALAAERED